MKVFWASLCLLTSLSVQLTVGSKETAPLSDLSRTEREVELHLHDVDGETARLFDTLAGADQSTEIVEMLKVSIESIGDETLSRLQDGEVLKAYIRPVSFYAFDSKGTSLTAVTNNEIVELLMNPNQEPICGNAVARGEANIVFGGSSVKVRISYYTTVKTSSVSSSVSRRLVKEVYDNCDENFDQLMGACSGSMPENQSCFKTYKKRKIDRVEKCVSGRVCPGAGAAGVYATVSVSSKTEWTETKAFEGTCLSVIVERGPDQCICNLSPSSIQELKQWTKGESPGCGDSSVKPPECTSTPCDEPEDGPWIGGDPHIRRWGQKRESFHGECDLVFAHSDSFHNGSGLDLQIRTGIVGDHSRVLAAVLRVGGDVFEIHHTNHLWFNGIPMEPTNLPYNFGDENFTYTINHPVPSKPVYRSIDMIAYKGAKVYRVDLNDNGSHIIFKVGTFMSVQIKGFWEDFADVQGLAGEHGTGRRLSRNGVAMQTTFEHILEWQVNSKADPILFLEVREPHAACKLQTSEPEHRRLLRKQNKKLFEEALAICTELYPDDAELCVDDVMVAGDIDAAYSW